MPDFSDPNVQYQTVLLIITFVGGMLGKKIPVLGPFFTKLIAFFKAMQPAVTPQAAAVSAAEKVQVATSELKVAVDHIPAVTTDTAYDVEPVDLLMDRPAAVYAVTELSDYYFRTNDTANMALANQMYANLHKPVAAVEE